MGNIYFLGHQSTSTPSTQCSLIRFSLTFQPYLLMVDSGNVNTAETEPFITHFGWKNNWWWWKSSPKTFIWSRYMKKKRKLNALVSAVCTLLKCLIGGHTIINDGNPQHNINPYWGKSSSLLRFSFQFLASLVNRFSDLVYNNIHRLAVTGRRD